MVFFTVVFRVPALPLFLSKSLKTATSTWGRPLHWDRTAHSSLGGASLREAAAQEGHEAVVELLIAAGADVDQAPKSGKTPL